MVKKYRIKLITIPWEINIPALSLPSLAAVTPADKFDIAIVDLLRERLIIDEPVDIVGITASTARINAAYALADLYRSRGVKTVIGGHHVTLLPEEGLQHADAVVVGEGENAWKLICEQFLKNPDLVHGIYDEGPADLSKLPLPRIDLMKSERYTPYYYPVVASRGCPNSCSFCFTGETTRKYETYPISHVLKQISSRPKRARVIAFLDDNFAGDVAYTRELLREIKKLNIKFGVQVRPEFILNPDNLNLLGEAGCYGISTGFESINQSVLAGSNKSTRASTYKDIITLTQNQGIMISSNWMFGFDWDTPDCFDATWEFLLESNIYHSTFSTLIPYPGSTLYNQLNNDGRIVSNNYDDYIGKSTAVHEPRHMTKRQLEKGVEKLTLKFFSFAHQRRVFSGWPQRGILFGDLSPWRSYLYLKISNLYEMFVWHSRMNPPLRWFYNKLAPYYRYRYLGDLIKKTNF